MTPAPIHPLFAAAGFGSALMLMWGLTAAIPVLLHLWNRRQRQEMDWAAMRFLLAAVEKNARRVRIEQLILLAVRMGILGLLAELELADGESIMDLDDPAAVLGSEDEQALDLGASEVPEVELPEATRLMLPDEQESIPEATAEESDDSDEIDALFEQLLDD